MEIWARSCNAPGTKRAVERNSLTRDLLNLILATQVCSKRSTNVRTLT